MIVGDAQELAIECEITEVYPGLGLRALGFLVLHRLIAFNSAWTQEQLRSSTAEVWMNADRFYALLWQWQNAFESEWAARLRLS